MPSVFRRILQPETQAEIMDGVHRMYAVGPDSWTREAWARDNLDLEIEMFAMDGRERAGPSDGVPVCWCVGAAVRFQCAEILDIPLDETGYFADVISGFYCALAGLPIKEDSVHPEPSLNALVSWNDDEERTFGEVTDLTGAAALAASQWAEEHPAHPEHAHEHLALLTRAGVQRNVQLHAEVVAGGAPSPFC